jgi:2-polyprenyl-3-methyl-5-hydroxy-6-metoxy-1,4-benzoquinol methylase
VHQKLLHAFCGHEVAAGYGPPRLFFGAQSIVTRNGKTEIVVKRMPASSTNPARLREMVRGAYSAAAEQPEEKHAFPVGRQFGESIGYPAELLARLPSVACDAFAGVSNVSLFADLPPGATVLDLGCGAGLDTLIAAQRVGTAGKVIGVDFSEAMLARARDAVSTPASMHRKRR